jgi:hypothetical protein
LAFPETNRSAVLAVGSADPEEKARALETVARAYWRPVHGYLRSKWRADEARART